MNHNSNVLLKKVRDILLFLSSLYPEILFSLFLIPTRFNALTEKFNIPSFLNPVYLLFAVIVCIIFIKVTLNNSCFIIPRLLLLSFIGFIIFMAIGLSYSVAFQYGLSKTLEFITLSSLACFAPFFLLNNLNVFERFLKTYIVLGFFLSIFIFVSSPYAFQFYSSKDYPKFHTTLGNNYLGLQYILGISILTMIYYFMFSRRMNKIQVTLAVLLTLLLGAALLYSPGKGPIISLFLTVIIMSLVSLKIDRQKIVFNRKTLLYTLSVLAGGILLLSTVGWMFTLRLQKMFEPGYYGMTERVVNSKIAFQVFLNHPFFGAGIGSFSEYAAKIEGIERMKYPHNLPLEIISEMGLTGFILFAFMIGYAFKQLFFLANKYRETPYHNLSNVVISFLIFTFLSSLTGGNINNPLLFAWIGIAFVLEPMINGIEV